MSDTHHPQELARHELLALSEEGFDVSGIELPRVRTLAGLSRWRRSLGALPRVPGWSYEEPSLFEEIRDASPDFGRGRTQLFASDVRRRILGAWLGRCAGCMCGKPVEGWTRERIKAAGERAGSVSLNSYIPLSLLEADGKPVSAEQQACTAGNITRAERDDDLDYTLVNLQVLETHGPDFTSRHVAEAWLSSLPYHQVFTAERVAYRNFVQGIWPPESAVVNNPFREWIGAQIRADMWGYACPGDPARAAELAFRDACISHTKNGIYGEMFFAAAISMALAGAGAREAIEIGLCHIPSKTRLSEALGWVVSETDLRVPYVQLIGGILHKLASYDWAHTLNNACIVLAAILCGEADFTRTVCDAVSAGLDTDCNGATAGSFMGALLGAEGIPSHWSAPLGDTDASWVAAERETSITGIAARMAEVAQI